MWPQINEVQPSHDPTSHTVSYAFFVDRAVCDFNGGTSLLVAFKQHGEYREVLKPAVLRRLKKSLEHKTQHDFPG